MPPTRHVFLSTATRLPARSTLSNDSIPPGFAICGLSVERRDGREVNPSYTPVVACFFSYAGPSTDKRRVTFGRWDRVGSNRMTKWHLAYSFRVIFSISPKSLFSVPRGRPSRAENGEIRRVMAGRGDMKKIGEKYGKGAKWYLDEGPSWNFHDSEPL